MPPALSIRNLCKVYPGRVEALADVSLEVPPGNFYGLLGPNGAGKSTVIGVICSLVRKSAGEVKIFGIDIDVDFSQAKRCIGVVPQEFNFNPFEKVFDILVTQAGYYGLNRSQARSQGERYLRELELWEQRNQQAQTLSGGMKRRLLIARALLHEPRLLILDEPTAGVDIELRRKLWDFLRNINRQGTTIILTTHYLEEAEQLCQDVGIIDRGRMISSSSTRDLLRRLHQEAFLLDLEQAPPQDLHLENYSWSLVEERCIEVAVHKGQSLSGLFAELSAQGIQVSSMRNKSNRLEEIFLSLVENPQQRRAAEGETPPARSGSGAS